LLFEDILGAFSVVVDAFVVFLEVEVVEAAQAAA